MGDGVNVERVLSIFVAVIVATAVLYLGIAMLHGASEDPDGAFTQTDVRLSGTGSFVSLHTGHWGDNETVFDSRGNAIRLTGADDSFFESDQAIDLTTDDNWTVSTWASVNDSAASENMTAISIDARLLIQYNGSQSNWSVWYFDEATANSYRANVSAPNQPGNLSLLTVQHNGSHLSLFRNQTAGETVNTSVSDSIADIYVNSTNWHGRLDETRVWDANITDTQRNSLFSNPIDPVVNSRTLRIYYDRGRGTTLFLFHATGDATLSNSTWVSGLAGTTLGGSDYDWEKDGPELKALAGGELDNQPVAWVDYNLYDEATRFALIALGTWDFADTVLLAVMLSLIIGALLKVREGSLG